MMHFWIKSNAYSMAVLYPKIVNAYTKFAQNCGYYKRTFSVLPRKHPTLLPPSGKFGGQTVFTTSAVLCQL